jgi:hypothetical protein
MFKLDIMFGPGFFARTAILQSGPGLMVMA